MEYTVTLHDPGGVGIGIPFGVLRKDDISPHTTLYSEGIPDIVGYKRWGVGVLTWTGVQIPRLRLVFSFLQFPIGYSRYLSTLECNVESSEAAERGTG